MEEPFLSSAIANFMPRHTAFKPFLLVTVTVVSNVEPEVYQYQSIM